MTQAGGLTAAIGRSPTPDPAADREPVDLRLDLGGRVGILMAEHRQEIRQQAEHDADGPRLGDPLGLQAVVAELGQRGEDGFTRGEVPQGLLGREGGGKGVERGEGLPSPGLLFEGGEPAGSPRCPGRRLGRPSGHRGGRRARHRCPCVWGKESVCRVA